MSDEFDQFKVLFPIGCGGYGNAYFAVKQGDVEKNGYSLKTVKENKRDTLEAFNKEIKILEKLTKAENNIYTPKLYGSKKFNIEDAIKKLVKDNKKSNEMEISEIPVDIKNRPFYVIDFFSRTELFYYVKEERTRFTELEAKVVFKQILEGFQFLHDNKICHLDIKTDNIMLDKNFKPIIIDFGFAEQFKDEPIFSDGKGTPEYICPEMWEFKKYNGIKSDIFSLGVVLFKLVTGKFGFKSANKNDKSYELIKYGKFNAYLELKKDIIDKINPSEDFKNLYFSMVAYEPKTRPEISDILKGDWLKEINELDDEKKKN